MKSSRISIGLIAIVIAIFIGIEMAFLPSIALGSDGEPTPVSLETITPTSVVPFISPRMAEPTLPAEPLLADKGAQVYWFVCLACHGDQGQGLTEEFRSMAFGEDMNCWQSKCHASNHPPEGFEFPRIIPPVIGQGTLHRFVNASELQDYLFTTMPWWSPGLLTEEESWQLTAFLLRQNGSLPQAMDLDVQQAGLVPVHIPFKPQGNNRIGQLVLALTIGMAAIIGFAIQTMQRDEVINSNRSERRRPNFLHHLHPPTIPFAQARWRYTLGAGGAAVFLAIVLLVTGVLEMFFYIPTPEKAGESIQLITFSVPFGGLVRGIHFWAAQGMVVIVVIHLLRIIFTGAFTTPRRFNYFIGLGLLLITLLLDFTGYVLRWDEGIRWALMVGTNLLRTIPVLGNSLYSLVIGGDQPGLATLTRFYAWHIFGLTLVLTILIVWHVFRVRRDGGISAPPPAARDENQRITRFELARREVLAMLVLTFILILAATLLPPPLAAPIYDSGATAITDTRAPWFFLWVQFLLRYGNAFWMGVAIPIGLLILLCCIPFLVNRIPEAEKGRWFQPSGRIAQIIAIIIVASWLIFTIIESKV